MIEDLEGVVAGCFLGLDVTRGILAGTSIRTSTVDRTGYARKTR